MIYQKSKAKNIIADQKLIDKIVSEKIEGRLGPSMVCACSGNGYHLLYKHNATEKEQIKKRLGFSPDFADGLALTFALPDMPASSEYELQKLQQSAGQLAHEWDPFSESRQ